MPLDVIEKSVERLIESDLIKEKFTVVFHAGEPMILGTTYYQETVELIQRVLPTDLKAEIAFQTNGILIDDEWCKFFKRHSVNVGISVDGPAFIHDRCRVSRNGKGSFTQVQEGIEKLRHHGIPFHTISVLTDFSLDHPVELFEYFYHNEIYRCGFNVEEVESVNTGSSLDISSAEMRMHDFLDIFSKQNAQNGFPLYVRELENAKSIIKHWNRKQPEWLTQSQELVPYKIVTVDYSGNFSTFSPELIGNPTDPENDMVYGNVFTDNFLDALETKKLKLAYQSIRSGIDKCRKTCDYFQFCGGGSPSNKYYENGTFNSAETLYCKLHRQVPFTVALESFENQVSEKRCI